MTTEALMAALNLPAASRVDQRVPKKLLLESGVPTAADKRLINEGIDAIQWLAVLKPATCGVPEFRDEVREYSEVAILQLSLREKAKDTRLIELLHRAVPYPVLLLVERGHSASVSLAHKRQALKEADKVVLEGEVFTVAARTDDGIMHTLFLEALDLGRQPKASLKALYQSWMDVLAALESSRLTGTFTILDSEDRRQLRRQALREVHGIDTSMKALRLDAQRASQMARQVELNMQIQRLSRQRERALRQIQGNT